MLGNLLMQFSKSKPNPNKQLQKKFVNLTEPNYWFITKMAELFWHANNKNYSFWTNIRKILQEE